jgi:DNA-binding MarR family transcriptional regulator
MAHGFDRVTRQLVLVMAYCNSDPDAKYYGFQIAQRTGVSRWTVYRILDRCERLGYATSERGPALCDGDPPRRVYRFTEIGKGIVSDLAGDVQRD